MKKQLLVPLFIILLSFTTYAIDTDGDGVIDSTETTDGTDPNDPCDYLVSSQTVATSAPWNLIDCDGDGEPNVTDPYPNDPCIGADIANVDLTDTTSAWYTADCDGDGTPNGEEVDPDSDGIAGPNGSDPSDPCDDLNGVNGNEDLTSTSAYAAADCDGDGVTNGTEIDPDGDNVPGPDGTDPEDPCDYAADDMTLPQTGDWNSADCDGDGEPNGTDTNPQDPCVGGDLLNVDLADHFSYWYMSDCDGDGVTNGSEIDPDGDGTAGPNGTDPNDSCDYIMANITITPTNTCSGNTITGNIKLDYNNNGCDSTDFPLSNVLVTSINGSITFSTFTDISGNYIQNTNAGNFSTSASGFSSSYSATPNAQNTNFVGTGNTDLIDFCVTPASTVNDLNIAIVPQNNPIPSNTVSYDVIYKNVGNTIVNGSVDFTYDNAKLTYQSSSISPTTITPGNLSYSYSTLNPYEIRIITITFLVSNASVGDILVFNSQVNPTTGDVTISDNSLGFAQIVSSTLLNRSTNNASNTNETNDVLVLEGNQIELQNADEYLHYAFRFENTSASTISNLIITTELSDKLDWNTIQLQKKTHTGEIIIQNGNQITFKFSNINLQSGSKGYIAYRIKPKSNVVVGDVISSQSNLYFDMNTVISTNTINTTIIANTASINNNFIENVTIYPNPIKGIINIKSIDTSIIKIEIYNLLGKLIHSKESINGIGKVDISNLESNIYILKITDVKGNSKIEKIIKK